MIHVSFLSVKYIFLQGNRDVLASLTNNIALKAPSKYLVNDTFAVMRVIFDQYRSSFTVSMEDIQCSNEEFVGILLLITC